MKSIIPTVMISLLTVVISLSFVAAPLHAAVDEDSARAFGRLVIQHQGRLKPVDTFARDKLLTFHHRSTFNGKSAAAWLADTLLDPETAAKEPLFKIRNDDVLVALDIDPVPGHCYSFDTLNAALEKMRETLHTLHGRQPEDRTMIENQLIDTYLKVLHYLELSRSLSGLTPTITIDDPGLAADFGLQPGQATSYLRIYFDHETASRIFEEFKTKRSDPDPRQAAINDLIRRINILLRDRTFRAMPLLPPETGERWLSAWELLETPGLSSLQVQNLRELEACLTAVYEGRPDAEQMISRFGGRIAGDVPVDLELFYNRARLFQHSLTFYIGGFLLLLGSMLLMRKWACRLSLLCLMAGAALHTAGLVIRMLIMGRAPVSNLYESVVFVGLVSVLFGIILELVRRDRIGLLTASTLGAVFHFLGFRHAAEGDTMGMLVAVLDSNFWLATHVVTITIGYGAAMVASLIGHIMLVRLISNPADEALAQGLNNVTRGCAVVALFFTTLGTILGGIWADQSWGRFWGWDPKENGALLIILWLLFALHGRWSGLLRRAAFAACVSLTSVTVITAWFGVNLLSVGLHNYGFSQKNMVTLGVICSLELVFAAAGYFIARVRLARAGSPPPPLPAA